MDTQTLLSQITQTWSLPSPSAILPHPLRPSPTPQTWPHTLLTSLHALSLLTPGAPDRAWNLLHTYFVARIREASYTGRHQGIWASLTVEDVDRARDSVRRMSVGRELEGRMGERKYTIRDEVGGKRKFSIRDEVPCEEYAVPSKKAKMQTPISELPFSLHEIAMDNALAEVGAMGMGVETGGQLLDGYFDLDGEVSPLTLPSVKPLLTLDIPVTSVQTQAQSLDAEIENLRRELEEAEAKVAVIRQRYIDAQERMRVDG